MRYTLLSFCGVWIKIGTANTLKEIHELRKEHNIDGRRDNYKIRKEV